MNDKRETEPKFAHSTLSNEERRLQLLQVRHVSDASL